MIRTLIFSVFILAVVGCSQNKGLTLEDVNGIYPYQAMLPPQLTPVPEIFLARTTVKPNMIFDVGFSVQFEIRNECVYAVNTYEKVSLVVAPPDIFLHKDGDNLAFMHEDGTILYTFGETHTIGTEGITDHLESPIPERCEYEDIRSIR